VVAKRTGLTPAVLRAWEKRYGVVDPSRTEGGQRLYSDDDVVRLSLLHRVVEEGRSIGQVAGMSTDDLEALVREDEAERGGFGGPAPLEGPFTVFAPTDEAFAAIPQADLEALLADKEALTAVLTYHVVPGKVMASDVVGLSSATTVNGQTVDIQVNDGTVMIDGARVLTTDIEASNGVIHVIDKVILPDM